MKFSKFLTICGITSALAISNLFHSNLGQVYAQSTPNTKAFVAFVNGSGDCCAENMTKVIKSVKDGGHQIWTTSYANFRNESSTVKAPVVNLSVNADALFIKEAAEKINSLPSNIPVVLIGHSYGGDSILKALPAITRRVQLVVVIDPVGTGGFRRVATERVVPPNVDYFMNRWQENGLTAKNVVPFDSRISGQIRCSAKSCDQTAQNLVRDVNGSEKRDDCGWGEVTCPGFVAPTPFRRGRKGTKALRVEHNTMPQDAYIQKTVGDRISSVLANFRPPSVASSPAPSTMRVTICNRISTGTATYFLNSDLKSMEPNKCGGYTLPVGSQFKTSYGKDGRRIQVLVNLEGGTYDLVKYPSGDIELKRK